MIPRLPCSELEKKSIIKLLRNCPEQYSELAKVDDVDSSAGINAARKQLSSNIAKPPPLFPYDYGWWKDAAGPLPVFFEGIKTSDFLQDLICSCKGKVMCGRPCVCNEQNMCCTELRPCQGSDFCMNPFSRSRENDRDSEGDDENDAD